MNKPIMKCGHAAQGTTKGEKPICVICMETIQANEQPNLYGRKAKCFCGRKMPSNTNLAFFAYKQGSEYDNFYCGCAGWD